jgi:hypothetical protein
MPGRIPVPFPVPGRDDRGSGEGNGGANFWPSESTRGSFGPWNGAMGRRQPVKPPARPKRFYGLPPCGFCGMIIIDEKVLDWFRGKTHCEWCSLACVRPDPHHVFGRGIGGGTRLDIMINLIALCRACHGECHNGQISRSDLLAVVCQREGLLQSQIVEKIWELRRQKK